MRHAIFVALLSVILTPIVALQENLSPSNSSVSSVQSEMIQTLKTVSHKATEVYSTVENRIYIGVRDLLN